MDTPDFSKWLEQPGVNPDRGQRDPAAPRLPPSGRHCSGLSPGPSPSKCRARPAISRAADGDAAAGQAAHDGQRLAPENVQRDAADGTDHAGARVERRLQSFDPKRRPRGRCADIREAEMQPLLERHARRAASPKDLADQCEIVFVSLPTLDAFRAAAFGEDGLVLGKTMKLLLNTCTVGVPFINEIAQGIAAQDVTLVECPISGGPLGARIWTLRQVRPIIPRGKRETHRCRDAACSTPCHSCFCC